MCGIAGVLSFSGSPFDVTAELIDAMRDALAHRGPDGAGTWVSPDQRIGFGHRRLAIIDLSERAAQPMCNADGSLWITFNGEIYNHAELRAELIGLGYRTWQTDHSDTEVILRAFEAWGIGCLKRLRGMFAFALWDDTRRELWLARDRMGIKPLYYSVHHGRVTFASEIKALLQDPGQRRAVDEDALFHYLSFLAAPAPQTLFAGIYKVPHGSWLRFSEDGRQVEQRYWDVWDHTRPRTGVTDADLAEELLALLRDSVAVHKASDVPIGVFLSGGIDSSTNAALFAEGQPEKLQTFSIGYAGTFRHLRDELPFAELMAHRVGAVHHERRLTPEDLFAILPTMTHLQDEPIADPTCVPMFYVAEMARQQGVCVCQVGEGADELFWGYPAWNTLLRLQKQNSWPIPGFLKELGLKALGRFGHQDRWSYELLRRGKMGEPVFRTGAEGFTDPHKQRLLSPRLRQRFAESSSWEVLQPMWDRFRSKAWEPSPEHWMTYSDLNLRLPDLLLMRVDKMAMGVSVETRVPFLDHRLVEFALSVPSAALHRHGTLKHLLKLAVKDLVPESIINRPKQGFGLPIDDWFRDRMAGTMRQTLVEFCRDTDYLDMAAIDRIIDNGKGYQAWFLYNLALWWRTFMDGV